MANTKSSKKRVRQSEKRYQINLSRRSSIKTAVKKVLTALSAGDKVEDIKKLMLDAESKLAKAKNKVLHANTSSRKISRLAKKVAAYSKSATK